MARKVVLGIEGNASLGVMRKPAGVRKSKYRHIAGKPMHRLIVEQRTGIKLKPHNQVHHFDPGDKLTNEGTLVVCEDASYHQLIERRQRAYFECGNANWIQCYRCAKWDDPKNLYAFTKREAGKQDRLHYLHEWRDGRCVPLSAPRPVNAWMCAEAPNKRHTVGSRFVTNRNRRRIAGLSSRCVWCEKVIRRVSEKSVRWFITDETVTTPKKQEANDG